MKKHLLLLTLFIGCFFASYSSFAQSEAAVYFNSLTLNQDSSKVLLSIKTTESFIVGANRYVLHISGQTFYQSFHPKGELNEIIFFIPTYDFSNLIAQSNMVLVYGFYHQNTLQDGEGNSQHGYIGKHWRIGEFTPELLKKN